MMNKEFKLPCGVVIKNRLVKPAMTEGMASEYQEATDRLCNLYSTWANESDIGMLISGNVQVDRRFLERPRNVVIDVDYDTRKEDLLKSLEKLAKAGKQNDTKFILQLGHAGRQSNTLVAKKAHAPSDITAKNSGIPVAEAQAATQEDIERIIEKFVYAAQLTEEAGFDGIEIHGAHGYLISSFLNPRANIRKDDYGGSLENRVRLLLTIIKRVKENRGENFILGVKLNSSDFQKGGFSVKECIEVVHMLAEEGVDFLELSGGNYETPMAHSGHIANSGSVKQKESTKRREAYFLVFAEEIVQSLRESKSELPILVTGGFRSRKVIEGALEDGSADLIGVGRPLCMDPSCTKKLLDGEIDVLPQPEHNLSLPSIFGWNAIQHFSLIRGYRLAAAQATYYQNFYDIADGKFDVNKKPNVISNLFAYDKGEKANAKALKGYKEDEFIQDYLLPKKDA